MPPLMPETLTVSCLCDAARQSVRSRPADDEAPSTLCHCDDCRHVSGLLCTSYLTIARPPSLKGLVAYDSSPGTTRYFCGICGCHVFRVVRERGGDGGSEAWEVATGAIVESPDEGARGGPRPLAHVNVSSTRDGGLSGWISDLEGGAAVPDRLSTAPAPLELTDPATAPSPGPTAAAEGADTLAAACHCRTVAFHITRPAAESYIAQSSFPDLMIPYHTQSPQLPNVDDVKWWLRSGATKYLAGTCTCRSCRLGSGFDIQTWAFVPRANIFLHVPAGNDDAASHEADPNPGPEKADGTRARTILPLDFHHIPSGILRRYDSSPGVQREFCPQCGATVFWHGSWRSELVDVSVGLLRAEEGARAEAWLDWWTERVSFVEDAGLGQTGWVKRRAEALAHALERGLRGSKIHRQGP
ncbi:hypothetical protein NKR23_g11285 [Pleurostoma richardsiae]|uniref:CENP-V/GFA domain-containing protein n=1 Tax=Pleurostoma richardsiae TaxID=41990 RepID=A0AA38VDM2_9PEZI|nr:hypothetical protein NKR23_g11285 [Pleurostoma richardsiae]